MNTKSDFFLKLKNQKTRFQEDNLYRFLNPNERQLVHNVFKDYYVYESDDYSEYRRVFVSFDEALPNFNITILKAGYRDQEISHRDVLGALTSMGIERNVFGDIFITDSEIFVQVDSKMKEYIKSLRQIRKDSILFEEVDSLPTLEKERKELITLSLDSLRIDALVSKAFKINREDVKVLIDQEKVKINFEPVRKYTLICKPCDIISVRGFGRIMFIETLGESKKQKTRIKCELLR